MISGYYSAATALYSNEIALKAISNDIANINTTGYKASSVRFADIFYEELTGARWVSDVGNGGFSYTVKPILREGPIKSTGSSTDVAIDGVGFFVVRDPDRDRILYTRDGTFILDSGKKLVTVDGLPVQGVMYTAEAAAAPTATAYTDIDLSAMESSFKPTETIELSVNLDASIDPDARVLDPTNPEDTADFITNMEVYDAEGNPVYLYFAFDKVDTNTWVLQVEQKTDEGFIPLGDPFTVEFSPSGLLKGESTFTLNIGDQTINISLEGSTQFASQSGVFYSYQDGFPVGAMTGVYINGDGEVVGIYSNGQEIPLARLVLAKFPNPWELERVGNNRFKTTYLSGNPEFFMPGDETGYAKVVGGALELSNVDLAEEFADLIATQWAFGATSKALQTLNDLVMMAIRRGF